MLPRSTLFLVAPVQRPTVELVLAVITELSHALAEENSRLAAGLPATDPDRRYAMSDHLAMLWAAFDRSDLPSDQAHRLIRATVRMRAAAEENAARLEAALAACHVTQAQATT